MNHPSPFAESRLLDFARPNCNCRYLKLLVDIAHYRHPTNKKKKFKLLIRSILFFRKTAEWYNYIAHSPLLSALVLKQKGLIEKPHKYYLRLDSTIEQRLKNIIDHYSIFTNLFDSDFVEQTLLKEGIKLGKLQITPDDVFELTLSVADDECKEGELAIRFHKLNELELSVIRFSLLPFKDGIMLYIAAIQGPKGCNSREKVKDACKTLNGLSPNRIVLESCLAFARHIQVRQILVVSDKQQVFKNKHTKYFSYDAFCSELGGVLTNDGDYRIPLFIDRKKWEHTPTKRRAKYRRQHNLLDTVSESTLHTLANYGSISSLILFEHGSAADSNRPVIGTISSA